MVQGEMEKGNEVVIWVVRLVRTVRRPSSPPTFRLALLSSLCGTAVEVVEMERCCDCPCVFLALVALEKLIEVAHSIHQQFREDFEWEEELAVPAG